MHQPFTRSDNVSANHCKCQDYGSPCFFLLLASLVKVLSIRDSLPHLRSIVLYGEDEVPSDVKVSFVTCSYNFQQSSLDFYQKGVVSWKELLDLGKATLDANLDNRLANIAINQVFGILKSINFAPKVILKLERPFKRYIYMYVAIFYIYAMVKTLRNICQTKQDFEELVHWIGA